MSADLSLAKQLLASGTHTIVAVKAGDTVAAASGPGLAPLLAVLDRLQGAAVADRAVGRAAALLLLHAGAACVHGLVLSEPGRAALDQHGCPASWDKLVPHIRNRMGTGLCPMEERALGMGAPAEAYRAFVLRE